MAFFDAVSAPAAGNAPGTARASGTGATPQETGIPAPSSSNGGFFGSVSPGESTTPSEKSGSFFDNVSTPTPTEPAQKDGSVVSPYFATTTPSGASIGFSTTLDASGKPLFAYRNPGDTSTTTDPTRVATTFDPRVAQPMSLDDFYNPRNVANRAALKTAMGGTYSDELDHTIPLELSGSNENQNLRIEPAANPNQPYSASNETATDPLENQLARAVASGQMSLFDAQTKMAKDKGVALPWTGAQDAPGTGSHIVDFLNGVASKIHDLFGPSVHTDTNSMAGLTNSTIENANPNNIPAKIQPGEYAGQGNWGVILAPVIKNFPVLGKAAQSIGDAINEGVNSIFDAINSTDVAAQSNPLGNQNITTGIKNGANVAMHALNLIPGWAAFQATLKGSEDIPVLSDLSKGIQYFLGDIGNVVSNTSDAVINKLPISDDAKETIRDAWDPLASLVAQIGVAHLSGATVAEHLTDLGNRLEDKLSTNTPLTPQEKAYQVLTSKLSDARTTIKNAIMQGYEKFQQTPARQGGFVSIGGNGESEVTPEENTANKTPAAETPNENGLLPSDTFTDVAKPISLAADTSDAEKSSAIERIAASKDPKEISDILKNELGVEDKALGSTREGVDMPETKLSSRLAKMQSTDSIRAAIEGQEPIKRGAPNKEIMNNLPSGLQERADALEIRRQALQENPAAQLEKYVSRQGEFQGRLKEATGQENATIFGKKGDQIAEQAGFKDSETARDAYEKYAVEKENFQRDHAQFKADLKDHITTEKAVKEKAIERKRTERAQRTREAAAKFEQQLAESNRVAAKYEKAVHDAHIEAAEKKTTLQQTKAALAPLKGVDAETQEMYKNWRADKAVAAEEGRELSIKMKDYRQVTGMQTIHDYEAGDQNPVLRTHGDEMYTRTQRAGIDLGYWTDHITHLYKEGPEKIRDAVAKRMEAEGVDKQTIDQYMKTGARLNDATALKLRVNPVFSYERAFPTYAEAMKYGLTPRYTNPVDIMAWEVQHTGEVIANRTFVDTLLSENKLLRAGDAPASWLPVDIPYLGKGDYMAPPELEQLLRNTFPPDKGQLPLTQRWFETALNTTAKIARGTQNFALYGLGVGNVNFWGIAQAIKDATTLVGAFPVDIARSVLDGSPDFSSTKTQLSLLKRFISTNFNGPTGDLFEKMQPTFKEMAEQGINTNNRIGGIDSASWRDIGDSFKTGDFKRAFGQIFSKSMEKTKDSYLPLQQALTFKEAKELAIKRGMPEEAAKQFAGHVTENYSAALKEMGTSQVQKNIADTLFMARQTRAGALGFYFDAIKSMTSDFKNKTFYKNRAFVGGTLLTYALYNYVNKQNTGKNIWENGSADVGNVIINIPPEIGKYLPGYKAGDTFKFPFQPSLSFGVRSILGTVFAGATGDFTTARSQIVGLASEPLQLLENIFVNQNYYGQPIYKDTDTGPQKVAKITQYLGLTFTPSFVKSAVDYIENKTPLYQAMYNAAFLPGKFSTLSKDQTSAIAQALNTQTTNTAQLHVQAEAEYAKMKGAPDAVTQYNQLRTSNPALAKAVATIAQQDKEGMTSNERMVKFLGVSNGARAKEIAQEINALTDPKAKAALWERYVQLKIISPQVATQLMPLIQK